MREHKKVLSALVVDDDATIRDSSRQVLERLGFAVDEAITGEDALILAKQFAYPLALLDLKMPGIGGMETLRQMKAMNPDTAVVVITGYPTIETAVEAIRLGASDFIMKPFTPDGLRVVVEKAMREKRLERENEFLNAKLSEVEEDDRYAIIGESPEIRAVLDLVRKVAPTESTVLITGESGTGKELIARAIHRQSARAKKPFVVVDCGTLVGSLFESELFGHVKGAFTGASSTTHGRFELADGGTIFFDEISNIGLETQAKLLRVIQEREFTRVGSNQVIRVDTRIIAATNSDLQRAVSLGTFREDLYYRLCVVPITLPPLRQRKTDIPLLCYHFLRKYARKRKKNVTRIDDDVLKIFCSYDWPGNVRELENAIERAVILANSDSITKKDILKYAYIAPQPPTAPEHPDIKSEAPVDEQRILTLREMEVEHIRRVLKQANGNKGFAAKQLGIDRKTLWRKIKKYSINE